jgi:uncharacterized protein (DUF1330 family)
MAKAYWIATYKSILDPAKHAQYAKIAAPAIEAAGGRFLARSSEITHLESGPALRIVLIEFPDRAAAMAAYNSDDYQRALTVVSGAVDREIRIVESLD